VANLIMDELSWNIRYIVARNYKRIVNKAVLRSTEWIVNISAEDKRILADVLKEKIENAPGYKPKDKITRKYETRLFEHYKKKFYRR
jgi:predicted polyphosphate/ATP-dependent NAD kinase